MHAARCLVDWVLLLEWFRVFSENWLWPILIFAIFLLIFRKHGKDIIDRLSEAYGVKFRPPPRQRQSQTPPKVSPEASHAPAGQTHDDFLASLHPDIRAEVEEAMVVGLAETEKVRPELRLKFLLTAAAAAIVASSYEWLYSQIYGSQLELVKRLLITSPMPVSEAVVIWEKGKSFKEFDDYSFEAWLGWLRDAAKVVHTEGDLITPVQKARGFFAWMKSNSRPLSRGPWSNEPAAGVG